MIRAQASLARDTAARDTAARDTAAKEVRLDGAWFFPLDGSFFPLVTHRR